MMVSNLIAMTDRPFGQFDSDPLRRLQMLFGTSRNSLMYRS
jgi:hypothetical protein